jgi:hypothetical protein
MAGKYTVVISGQTNSQLASPPDELARIQFSIDFAGEFLQH